MVPLFALSVVVAVVGYVLWEWASYQRKTRSLPGPAFFVPIIGSLVQMVMDPIPFWDRQKQLARSVSAGISRNFLAGRIMLFVTKPELVKAVFDRVTDGDFRLFAHPSAQFLLGDDNMIYMEPHSHMGYRRQFMKGLFNTQVLLSYLPAIERTMRAELELMVTKYDMHSLEKKKQFVDIQMDMRRLTALTSQQAHIGPYMHDNAEREYLSDLFIDLTFGFLCFPIPVRPFMFGKALHARKEILRILERVSIESMTAIKGGKEPDCVVDYWCQAALNNQKVNGDDSAASPLNPHDMSNTILDLLFAAQDATTSAFVWVMDIMCQPQYARIFEQVRAEMADFGANYLERFEDMKYTSYVAEELLRFKPPVPMVPHIALRDCQLGSTFVPKGAMVVPSLVGYLGKPPAGAPVQPEGEGLFDSLTQGGDLSDVPRHSDFNFDRAPFVFGSGQHKCAGRRYATMSVKLFMCVLAQGYELQRDWTPKSREVMYLPTLFPAENKFRILRKDAQGDEQATAGHAAPHTLKQREERKEAEM